MIKIFISTLLILLSSTNTFADSEELADIKDFDGNWHLRVLDGNEVRKARAIIDFHSEKMIIKGFDGCNRLSGELKVSTQNLYFSKIITSRMACRQQIHSYVSKRLQETIKEGFTITEETRYGVDGITIKSKTHNLFFKRMGDNDFF